MRRIYLCDCCSRTFREDAHTMCGQCFADFESVQRAHRQAAAFFPQLWRRSILGAAHWAFKQLVRLGRERQARRAQTPERPR